MKQYLIRRLFQTVPVLLLITILIFAIVINAPGSPVSKMLDPSMTPEEKARIESKFGLDKSIPEQYLDWISEVLLKGNLGFSTKFARPVTDVMQDHMWNTFQLALFSLFISLIVGIPTGIISATRQYSKVDYGLTIFALLGISIPSFFFGLLLIKFLSIDLGWFPMYGRVDPDMANASNFRQFIDILWHMILPGIVLGLGATAGFMRYTRATMLEVIRQDYIRTARSKGLKEKVVIYKHALRNGLIPVITLLGFRIPLLFSGALITEQIFKWPGMGSIGIAAILDRDYPLLMGVNLFLAFLTLIGNLMADIFYGFADPRIKYD